MSWRIRITLEDYAALRGHLLRGAEADEEAAFLLCGTAQNSRNTYLTVHEVVPVPDEQMLEKGRAGITFSPEFVAPLLKRCRMEGFSLVQTHSHPFSRSSTTFSGIDDFGEQQLFPKLQARAPDAVFAAVVFGQGSLDARVWPPRSRQRVQVSEFEVIGQPLERIVPTSATQNRSSSLEVTFSRQVPILGTTGQALLERLVVGVVGLGGIGSHVAQQLVHLGVGQLILVDPDVLEESNRSRVVGSGVSDVGVPKAEMAKKSLLKISKTAEITAISGNIYHASAALHLKDCDVVFSCTDTLVSRMVLTRFAAQYLVPLIDMGINVQIAPSGEVRRVGGRVMVQLPRDPCLDCLGILDQEQLALELMTPEQRRARPYVEGEREEFAPSVVTFNGVVGSLATTEFLKLVSSQFRGDHESRSYQVYDGIRGIVRRVEMRPEKSCGVCSEVRGLADLVALPCALDR